MIRLFTLFTLFFLLSTNSYSTLYLKGHEADERIPGTVEVWYKYNGDFPQYIRFNRNFELKESETLNWLIGQFNFQSELHFTKIREFKGSDGLKHTVYECSYNDVHLEFLRLSIHSRDGMVQSISGNLLDHIVISNSVSISEGDALKYALDEIHSISYKWDIPEEEAWLRESRKDNAATFYPKGNLVIISANADYRNANLRYAYKFDIYSQVPYTREDIYIDAQTGMVLFRNDRMNEIDSVGTAHTGFSGVQEITTDKFGSQFRLREASRGNGIVTWNLKTSSSFAWATDFWDDDNFWDNQTSMDHYATDAHWAAEKTYDYYKNKFDRNGIDDHGYQMNLYVHFGENYQNASWDGQHIIFGDGISNPYTTVDITAHEITHGLTDFTANLISSNESGALNESFSDIFGNCVERAAKPGTASWLMGEDRGSVVRDMSNPNSLKHPDTYHGMYWYTGSGDNGGVHYNCGVQNFWFYLLSEGGNGINDIGKSYSVSGIGIDNAALIAYDNLLAYLNPLSDYEDARFFSEVAAIERFGNCSRQHEAVVNAWYAVGLGEPYVDHAIAKFSADRLEFCSVPFTINFKNESANGLTYLWTFSDGSTSNAENPSHTFLNLGKKYTVSLSVDGKGCGEDEVTKEDFINAVMLEKPTGESVTVLKGKKALLKGQSSTGVLYWFKDANSTDQVIYSGTEFETPELFSDTSFFVRTVKQGNTYNLGPDISMHEISGTFSSSDMGIRFNVYQSIILESVTVKAGSSGSRTIAIKDGKNNIVFEKSVILNSGIQEVPLDAHLKSGDNFLIYVSSKSRDLWRHSGMAYPVELAGICTITSSNLPLDSIYPFFYNWKVRPEDCLSEAQEISVGIESRPTGPKKLYNFYAVQSGNGGYNYFVSFNFPVETSITYGLYSINGQKVLEYKHSPPYNPNGGDDSQRINLNELLNFSAYPGGVYFLTIKGGELEKSERVILKAPAN